MKLSCKVIEDILPMYYDKVCSEETKVLVEQHLQECPHCSKIMDDLADDFVIEAEKPDDIKPLKRLQKSYMKKKMFAIIAIILVVAMLPIVFVFGNWRGEQRVSNQYAPDFSQEEAIAYANEFMACLVNADYAKAYTYWDIELEKKDLLSGNLFEEDDLANFETDGLKKFCDGGETLEKMGGFESFTLKNVYEDYDYSSNTEEYNISYTVRFDGKDEGFGLTISKNGISSLRSGGGLIRHPLTHITLWVQWVVDDYTGSYYDRELGEWVDAESD